MPDGNPRSLASILGHPLHVMLVPVPVTCFVGALVADLTYACTANLQWANFSGWLLAVGVIVAALAALFGFIDFLGDRRIRVLRAAWIHALGNVVMLVLAIFNLLVHMGDGYTAVVPFGLGLSALTVLVLLVTGWNGWSMVHRHGVGVLESRP
jgi:uncharacterized membrane protein